MAKSEKKMKFKTSVDFQEPTELFCHMACKDCMDFLRDIPDSSVQLIIIDPPYNIDVAQWDTIGDYVSWASKWIDEAYRVLSPNGSLVIFGGTQFHKGFTGDLLDLVHYIRRHTLFHLVNTVVWYYKNGASARRFFANRHEEAVWFVKGDDYYFDLDAVRIPYDEKGLSNALKDKRLNKESVLKGKNPTNVWQIGRLNGNAGERVGHPTQKPLEIVTRFVRALSYPGSVVLDFFSGSGTTGEVCLNEFRHCLMCDNDTKSKSYFDKRMYKVFPNMFRKPFTECNSIDEFFSKV